LINIITIILFLVGKVIFYKTFTSAVATTGKVYCGVDNSATIYFNNEYINQMGGWVEVSSNINIIQGSNTITIIALNDGGTANPAGLIASVYSDSSASFIVQTDSTWLWTDGGILHLLNIYI